MSGTNNQGENSNSNIASELDAVQQEIDRLKQRAEKIKQGAELDQSDLYQIQSNAQQEKFNRIEHHYKKKGVLHYWYVKVPLRILNVGSIKDGNRLFTDSYRSLTARICPSCGEGMLMFNRNHEPVNGNVVWFCSKQPSCEYEVLGPPSGLLELNPPINEIVDADALLLGQGRWERLSDIEKDELISSHLEKAKIYRAFAVLLGVLMVLQLILSIFMQKSMFAITSFFILLLTSYVALLSIHWAYRAWQIKTGNVFLPESPFYSWLQTAEKYYSVDWVDEENQGNKSD